MKLESIAKGAQISGIEEGKFARVPIRSFFTKTLERPSIGFTSEVGRGKVEIGLNT